MKKYKIACEHSSDNQEHTINFIQNNFNFSFATYTILISSS